jgi:hypothetical protein
MHLTVYQRTKELFKEEKELMEKLKELREKDGKGKKGFGLF